MDSRRLISLGILVGFVIFISFTYISALLAFDAPSRDFPLRIMQVDTLDANNVSQTSFGKGTTMRFNSSVEKALRYLNVPFSYQYFDFIGNTDFIIIVAVQDANKVPVHFQSLQDTISSGEQLQNILNYNILPTAAIGTYTYTVMVWSDWLPSGDIFSMTVWEGTFSVS